MKLTGLAPLIGTDEALDRAMGSLASKRSATLVAPLGVRSPALAALTQASSDLPLIVLTATGHEAKCLTVALCSWSDAVEMLPTRETFLHERLSPQVDTMVRRIVVLRRLAHPVKDDPHAEPLGILVTPTRAFLQPIIRGLVEREPVRVYVGDRVDLPDLARRLGELGHQRVDMVEDRGQPSIRGGILDVFPPQEAHPVRVGLWDDGVDEIRVFSVQDQHTLSTLDDGLWVTVCRGLLLTRTVHARACELAAELSGAAEMLALASEGIPAPGIESLVPVLSSGMERLLDLLLAGSSIICSDPERVRVRVVDLLATTEGFFAAAWSAATEGAQTPLEASQASFLNPERLQTSDSCPWWELSALPLAELAEALGESEEDESGAQKDTRALVVPSSLMAMGACGVRPHRGDFAVACTDLGGFAKNGWTIAVTTEDPEPARHIRTILSEAEAPATLVDDILDAPQPGMIVATTAQAGSGFVTPELKLAILSESNLTDRVGAPTRDMRRMPSHRRKDVDPFSPTPGDYIVHDQHGIGRFIEFVSRTTGRGEAAVRCDCLILEYAPSKRGQSGDRLYVPNDCLDQISKYTGSDQPSLTEIDGADWAKVKVKARKAVNEIAREFIRPYVACQATKGHAFALDTLWQRELEDAFPYVETPDQFVMIDGVRADMERPIPMDRLLTGDAGYGRTEIAVRAAFKAVQDGKQAAVLVSTTLFVQQYIETFTERCAGFPVTIVALSRFSTPKEAGEVKAGSVSGKIDLVIGTHSLLTGAISFKTLGLVIIDEKQRFGVEHKETLKAIRTDVGVLSMSATPIPGTLEMAVPGIRETPILQTPPEGRQPVLTSVGAYTDVQVSAAIRRELLRDGQVFLVHNRVDSIASAAAHIQELVLEARVYVTHGKLSEYQLEEVIVDPWNHEFDMPMCTTIIEIGPDISNANTLIVDRVDVSGLSQLHQLRG